jgi:hypothetical protein
MMMIKDLVTREIRINRGNHQESNKTYYMEEVQLSI